MNYGFVKVAAAVPHVKVADCKFNVERIESLIAVAEGKGVQIIIFPEMSITDRKSTRLNSSHPNPSRMPSSA